MSFDEILVIYLIAKLNLIAIYLRIVDIIYKIHNIILRMKQNFSYMAYDESFSQYTTYHIITLIGTSQSGRFFEQWCGINHY
jgi:hypothetical protein